MRFPNRQHVNQRPLFDNFESCIRWWPKFCILNIKNIMSRKFVLILYYLLPCAVFGQAVVPPNYPRSDSVPAGLNYYPANTSIALGQPHIPAGRVFVFDAFSQYGDNYSVPLGSREAFQQPVHSEPISLRGMIRRGDNKMGASATGAVVYTGMDDVFAYAHYGRTGKLIWRTSPIANNMMATRWSLANFDLFRKASLPSIQTN